MAAGCPEGTKAMKKITLSMLFQNHMMLQCDKTLYISGTAAGVSRVRIVLHFGQEILSEGESAVENGRFVCTLPPVGVRHNLTLSLYAEDEPAPAIEVEDISAGDIWMAMGQSNMEYFLRYDADWPYTCLQKRDMEIRMFNVPQICYKNQQRILPDAGYWFCEGAPAWPAFSAPGYYFARKLREDFSAAFAAKTDADSKAHMPNAVSAAAVRNVPMGVIGCNWGGTPACAWMSEEDLADEPLNVWNRDYEEEASHYTAGELRQKSEEGWRLENSYHHAMEWRAVMYGLTEAEQKIWMMQHEDDPVIPMGPYHMYRPSGLYHTMLEPVTPFAVKGILWYQGESDAAHPDIYDRMMEKLIERMRTQFRDPSLPFLFVQLAPFGHWLGCGNEGYSIIRGCQQKVSESVPHAAMASIMDIGSRDDIHPKFKKEVGRRLALLAEKYVYGLDSVLADAPYPRTENPGAGSTETGAVKSGAAGLKTDAAKSGAGIPETGALSRPDRTHLVLRFDYAGTGLYTDETPEEGFLVLQNGAGVKIRSAEVSGDTVILTLDERVSSSPVRVSYCEKDYCTAHIWNSAGLSARPFHLEQI